MFRNRIRAAAVASAALALAGLGLASAPAASAAPGTTSTIDVSVNVGPSFDYWYDNDGPCSVDTEPGHYYTTMTVSVSARGDYDYVDTYEGTGGLDILVGVYSLGGFDPANPLANCISSGDDNATFDLSSADSYTFVVTSYYGFDATGNGQFTLTGPGTASVGSGGAGRNLTVWQQAVGRASADAACDAGWTASWMEWPNGGTGGFVCVKSIYAYYPDEPVPVQ